MGPGNVIGWVRVRAWPLLKSLIELGIETEQEQNITEAVMINGRYGDLNLQNVQTM